MNKWQPIETAPKDGSDILLGTTAEANAGYGYVCEGHYVDEHGWYQANTDWTDTFDGEVNPTHWMPLPPPPDTQGAERSES